MIGGVPGGTAVATADVEHPVAGRDAGGVKEATVVPGAFPQRAALNMLGGSFLTDFYAMVAHWARWATGIVEDWPDDPRQAVPDRAALEATVRLAERIAAIGAEPRR